MAVVEGNDGFILTKAQSTWLRGGGDRGDHGGASSEMAGAFFAATSKQGEGGAMAGGCGSVAARGGRRGKTKWDGECVRQARGVTSDTATTPGGARRVAARSAGRRHAAHTRPAFSENGRSL